MNGRLESRLSALEKATGAGVPRVIVAESDSETQAQARARVGIGDGGEVLLVYTGVPRAQNRQ